MGIVKAEMARQESLTFSAIDALIRAKLATRCQFHEEIVYIGELIPELSKAYAIGTNMLKAGEVDGDRAEFMDAIKSAFEEIGLDECPICT
jgi:hypothetical protein